MKKIGWLLLTAMAFYACGSVPVTGRQQLMLVSDQEMLSLSLQEYNDYIKSAKKSSDKTNAALVEKVGRKIAAAVETYFKANGMEALLSGYYWEFNLIDDPQVNAFCMPGGKIVVYTGILPYTQDETGLAVVLGHEVGHAIAKHANERMSQQILLQTGGSTLSSVLSNSSAKAQTIGAIVYGLGAQVGVMLPFNRKQELEADHLGLVLMAIAGYNPELAVPFWQRMSQKGGGSLEFLSTHPSDATRITEIRKKLPDALKYYNGSAGKNSVSPNNSSKKTSTSENWRF
ncbi:MAG: M48 family metallopeptidase [Dysgonamonadaceae bacterium]|jgi:predicted Zn-dependent protease|nr:M48 family metallopeptidase [Dysgonamonadaceae bacterium]